MVLLMSGLLWRVLGPIGGAIVRFLYGLVQ